MVDEFLTPEEYAIRVHVNPDTIRRLARDGELPALKVGRQWRLPASSLVPSPPEEADDAEDTITFDELADALEQICTRPETAAQVVERDGDPAGRRHQARRPRRRDGRGGDPGHPPMLAAVRLDHTNRHRPPVGSAADAGHHRRGRAVRQPGLLRGIRGP